MKKIVLLSFLCTFPYTTLRGFPVSCSINRLLEPYPPRAVSRSATSTIREESRPAIVINRNEQLEHAIEAGNLDEIRTALAHGADIDKQHGTFTPLERAARRNQIAVAELLLQRGAHINKPDERALTALHYAVWEGHGDMTKLLLDHGAIIDIQGGSGNDTPLHLAAFRNNIDIVKLLIARGADIDMMNNARETAYDVTKRMNIIASYELLENARLEDIRRRTQSLIKGIPT